MIPVQDCLLWLAYSSLRVESVLICFVSQGSSRISGKQYGFYPLKTDITSWVFISMCLFTLPWNCLYLNWWVLVVCCPEVIILILFFFPYLKDILVFILYLWSSPKLYSWVVALHLFHFLICFLFKGICQKYMTGRKESNDIIVRGSLAFSCLSCWALMWGRSKRRQEDWCLEMMNWCS